VLRAIVHGLRRLTRRPKADRALDDEIAQFLEMSAEQYMRAGLSRADAERAARLDFGGIETAKTRVRQ